MTMIKLKYCIDMLVFKDQMRQNIEIIYLFVLFLFRLSFYIF